LKKRLLGEKRLYDGLSCRYRALQGYDLNFETNLEEELRPCQEEFKKLDDEAEQLNKALEEMEVLMIKLEGGRQELRRIMTVSNIENMELVGRRIRDLLDKVPELRLLLVESIDIVDAYKAVVPKMEMA
jgi:predicted RNase H-like nuclease (RuvC/YqgF family)